MNFYLVNYADDRFDHKGGRFRENQLNLNKTAREQGITNIISWGYEDLIKTDFFKRSTYLDKPISDNYSFKPYIILDVLKKIEYGDILFYYDCGPWGIRRSVQPLIDLCISNNGTVFQRLEYKNSDWTKRDTFVYMDCDQPKYHQGSQLVATWMLFQKNDLNINFVSDWLKYNLDERIASSGLPNACGLPNLPGFRQHRHDQSIFSILAIKYGIKTFNLSKSRDVNIFIDLLTTPMLVRLPKQWIYKLRDRLEYWRLIGPRYRW